MVESKELVEKIVEGIQNIKGKGIVVIDLSETGNSICSYFVICAGDSSTHVNSIADNVMRFVKTETKMNPISKDGFVNRQWIALDYGDVLVHTLQREAREFYRLEELWADGKVTEIEDLD